MYEQLLCKKALNRMKQRVQDEIHTASSDIYTEECDRLVQFDKLPRSIIGLYIKGYSHFKSTFMKLRKGLKPAIPHDLGDLNFEGDNIKNTQTTDKMPFLRQYCRDPASKFLFFASNEIKGRFLLCCTSDSSFYFYKIGIIGGRR